jgi:hypothetical protein
LKIRLSFLVLNLVFVTGLFFPGLSVGVYFCTFAPLLVLLKNNHGVLKSSKVLIFIGIFAINVCFQILIGYPPNFKLLLNFIGNFLMIYSIISLLPSEVIFRKYLEQFLKLQFLVGSMFTLVALALYGVDFYFINKNEIYSSLNIYPPALWITKQVTAPFLAFTSIMALYIIKPNHFVRNTIVVFFMISALILSLGSRSAMLAIVVTICIFGFKKYLSKTPITITFVSTLAVAFFAANSYLSDYLDIIKLIDIRGIIYSQILSEVATNPMGFGYGNTVEYLSNNNSDLYNNTYLQFQALQDANPITFGRFEIETFPVNAESSLFVLLLEQGVFIAIFFFTYFITKISQMLSSNDRFVVLFTFASSVVFFTSLTEDNFLLIPYMFYLSLLLRLFFFKQNKISYQ